MSDTTEITSFEAPAVVEAAPLVTTAAEWTNVFNTPVAEPDAPPAPEAPKGLYDRFREIVADVDDEDSLVERFRDYHGQVPALQAKVQELEGRKVEYPTKAAEQLALYQQSLIDGGETDERVFNQKSMEFMLENSRNYTEMAASDPAKVLEIALRKQYPRATPEEIAVLLEDEGVVPAPSIDNYGDESDPDYVRDLAAYNKSRTRVQLKARTKAEELEAAKQKLDFKPREVVSREAEDAAAQEYMDYLKAEGAKVAAMTEISIGGEKFPIKVEGKLKEAFDSAVANPGVFERMVLGDAEGRHNPAKFLEILAFPEILKRERDLAYRKGQSEAVKAQEASLLNSSRNKQPEPNGQRTGIPRSAADWIAAMNV